MTTYALKFRTPTFVNRATGRVMPNDTGWQDRHKLALVAPSGFEIAIVYMIDGWARYVDAHRRRYETELNDHVLGAAWRDMGHAILALLNGETGRLDCGTLDGFIRDTLASEGWAK